MNSAALLSPLIAFTTCFSTIAVCAVTFNPLALARLCILSSTCPSFNGVSSNVFVISRHVFFFRLAFTLAFPPRELIFKCSSFEKVPNFFKFCSFAILAHPPTFHTYFTLNDLQFTSFYKTLYSRLMFASSWPKIPGTMFKCSIWL